MHSHVAEELLSNLQSKVDICENGSAHHLLNMPHITPIKILVQYQLWALDSS